MPFSHAKFAQLRPFLYHLTAASNLGHIRETRTLRSATSLLRAAGQPELIQRKRPSSVKVYVGGVAIALRDQAPLHAGNVSLPPGWEFADLVEMLNGRVYFWPGSPENPIEYGQRHFNTYAGEPISVLRVPTGSMLSANPDNPPLFCRYNSGAPRCTSGAASPRGPETFQEAASAIFTPGDVKEVTFIGSAHLPQDTEYASAPAGPWRLLSREGR